MSTSAIVQSFVITAVIMLALGLLVACFQPRVPNVYRVVSAGPRGYHAQWQAWVGWRNLHDGDDALVFATVEQARKHIAWLQTYEGQVHVPRGTVMWESRTKEGS